MLRSLDRADELLNDWQADAALIRKGEPPTMWAVYAMCWNQVMDRHYGRDALKYQKSRTGSPFVAQCRRIRAERFSVNQRRRNLSLQSGLTSAPRRPHALQTNPLSMSDSLTSLRLRSPLTAMEWLQR